MLYATVAGRGSGWLTHLLRASWFCLLAAVACGGGPTEPGAEWDPATERSRLADARANFAATASTHYVSRYTRRCPCDGDLANPSLAVLDGVIEGVWDVTSGVCLDPAEYGRYYSIEGFFALIEQAIDDGVDRLGVSYHRAYGNPTAILIDPDEGVDSDELDFPLIGNALPYDEIAAGWCAQ
jgi:hypothetical protein